jgi:lipase
MKPPGHPPRSARSFVIDEKRIDVPVAGGQLALQLLGRDTQGPPVLAIHGITSCNRSWLAVASALGDGPNLAAVDLRGRGASSRLPAPFGIAAHVEDMIAVLDHLGVEHAVVAGHSLGAYVAARLAAIHPERVRSLVLVDGGLRIPGTEGKDPEPFLKAFLGPALARLDMAFENPEAYRDWWQKHPAFAGTDIDPEVLAEYARYDLRGEPPDLRPRVNSDAVRADGADLFALPDARVINTAAVLLSAPRGLVNDPNPMQPPDVVEAWVQADPERRRGAQVPDVNHYTIVLGARGAGAVAAEIVRAAEGTRATEVPAAALLRPT